MFSRRRGGVANKKKSESRKGAKPTPTRRRPCESALLSGENPAQEALKL